MQIYKNYLYCEIKNRHEFHELIMEEKIIYREESYRIIGICMEVHRILGKGHSEVIYKDAIEYEFKLVKIPYSREQNYKVDYKDIV